MATVDTIGKVRRAYFVQKHSIKQIAREQRLARNTVRSIVCAPGETERCYERRAQPSLRLGVFVPALDAMLAANAAAPKRERLTFLRLFEDLRLEGCRGGLRRRPALCACMGHTRGRAAGRGLRASELRAG